MRDDGPGRRRLLAALHVLLRPLEGERRAELLGRIAAWAGPGAEDGDGAGDGEVGRPLTTDELRRLAAGPVTVGAHSVDHPPLAGLSPERLAHQVAGSKSRLEALLGHGTGAGVDRFAYPFGLATDVDPAAVAAVGRAGFRCACLAEDDTVGRSTDPLRLGRLWVDDVPAETLERRLRWWIGG